MLRIQLLDENVANQIAAGEVIERPASVVKELLENSLDAGATVIEIDIEHAGLGLIKIRDDGTGIHKDDLILAVTQHATSKIRDCDDLLQIRSLGFRGEALASIYSVAECDLFSKQPDSNEAWRLTPEQQIQPIAHPDGTTVEVRNLFAKIPVRRKFLKAARTEFAHIDDVVRRFTLSAHHVGVSLRHNGKQIFRVLPVNSTAGYQQRLANIVGKNFAEQSIYLDETSNGLRLWGWILPPEQSRAHADQQYFFVNGRVVKDKVLQHAVRVAFDDTYQQGRYPAYVLYLECDPKEVDVNVHPTKHEVRFHQQRLVHDFVQSTLHKIIAAPTTATSPNHIYPVQESTITPRYTVQQNAVPYNSSAPKNTAQPKALAFIQPSMILAQQKEYLCIYHYPHLQRYLIKLTLQNKTVKAQRLLIPATIVLPENSVRELVARADDWQAFGIGLRQVGPQNLLIDALPACLIGANLTEFFNSLIQQQNHVSIIDYIVTHTQLAKNLSRDEMQVLIDKLTDRPTAELIAEKILLIFNANELEQFF